MATINVEEDFPPTVSREYDYRLQRGGDNERLPRLVDYYLQRRHDCKLRKVIATAWLHEGTIENIRFHG